MKKASFILVSIILLSCNGNNSVRNQEYADVDSAVIDTMDVQPLKDESHKKLAKNNTADPIVGTYYCYRTQDTYVFYQTRQVILLFKEEVLLTLFGSVQVRMSLLCMKYLVNKN